MYDIKRGYGTLPDWGCTSGAKISFSKVSEKCDLNSYWYTTSLELHVPSIFFTKKNTYNKKSSLLNIHQYDANSGHV